MALKKMSHIKRILKWIWDGKYLYLLIILILSVGLADNFCIWGLKTMDNICLNPLIHWTQINILILDSKLARL